MPARSSCRTEDIARSTCYKKLNKGFVYVLTHIGSYPYLFTCLIIRICWSLYPLSLPKCPQVTLCFHTWQECYKVAEYYTQSITIQHPAWYPANWCIDYCKKLTVSSLCYTADIRPKRKHRLE